MDPAASTTAVLGNKQPVWCGKLTAADCTVRSTLCTACPNEAVADPFVSMTICLYMCGNAARPIRQHIELTLCDCAVAGVGSSECHDGAAGGARQTDCASHGGCYLRQGASTGGQGALLTITTYVYCLLDAALVKANTVLTFLLCPVSLL